MEIATEADHMFSTPKSSTGKIPCFDSDSEPENLKSSSSNSDEGNKTPLMNMQNDSKVGSSKPNVDIGNFHIVRSNSPSGGSGLRVSFLKCHECSFFSRSHFLLQNHISKFHMVSEVVEERQVSQKSPSHLPVPVLPLQASATPPKVIKRCKQPRAELSCHNETGNDSTAVEMMTDLTSSTRDAAPDVCLDCSTIVDEDELQQHIIDKHIDITVIDDSDSNTSEIDESAEAEKPQTVDEKNVEENVTEKIESTDVGQEPRQKAGKSEVVSFHFEVSTEQNEKNESVQLQETTEAMSESRDMSALDKMFEDSVDSLIDFFGSKMSQNVTKNVEKRRRSKKSINLPLNVSETEEPKLKEEKREQTKKGLELPILTNAERSPAYIEAIDVQPMKITESSIEIPDKAALIAALNLQSRYQIPPENRSREQYRIRTRGSFRLSAGVVEPAEKKISPKSGKPRKRNTNLSLITKDDAMLATSHFAQPELNFNPISVEHEEEVMMDHEGTSIRKRSIDEFEIVTPVQNNNKKPRLAEFENLDLSINILGKNAFFNFVLNLRIEQFCKIFSRTNFLLLSFQMRFQLTEQIWRQVASKLKWSFILKIKSRCPAQDWSVQGNLQWLNCLRR